MNYIKFDKNVNGRDYVVGDLRGDFSWMDQWLKDVDFEYGTDRLFCVGNLIGMRSGSVHLTHWLETIITRSVIGSHEKMFLDTYKNLTWPLSNYIKNGGAWSLTLTDLQREFFLSKIQLMPYAIGVETDVGLIGITHAECMTKTWNHFVNHPTKSKDSSTGLPSCTWGSDRLRTDDVSIVEGVKMIMVGHTPLKSPIRLGNHNFIDTGAGYGLEPTVVKIQGA